MVILALSITLLLTAFWQYSTATRHKFLVPSLGFNNHLRPQWTGILACAALLPLFLVLSLQYSLHSDYDNYVSMFNSVQAGNSAVLSDPLCLLIFKIVGLLGLDFQFVLIIIYVFSLTVLSKCIYDYSSNWAVSVLVFFCLFFALAFLALRQLPAVMIVFYSYRYIFKKNFIKFCLCVLIATGFHLSAIIMLPFYFILRIKFKLSYYCIIFAILASINIFQAPVLEFVTKTFIPKYYGSSIMYRNTVFNKGDTAMVVMLVLIVFLYYIPMANKKDINQLFINSFFIEVLLFFTCRWIPEFDRFGFYFYMPMIALVPNMLNCDPDKKQRWFMMIFVPALIFIIFIYRTGGSPIITNYVSIFG